jgi:hypothetical protein
MNVGDIVYCTSRPSVGQAVPHAAGFRAGRLRLEQSRHPTIDHLTIGQCLYRELIRRFARLSVSSMALIAIQHLN